MHTFRSKIMLAVHDAPSSSIALMRVYADTSLPLARLRRRLPPWAHRTMEAKFACVSKVRKELYDLPGVTRADIHFDAERKVDTALVVFDPEVVSPETLIATVEDIGDGLYDVETAEVVHYAPESSR